MARYDAILIPGGGLVDNGELPRWVTARLDRALALREDELLLMPLSAGTPHRRRMQLEAVQAARYLLERGVAAESVLVEAVSLDTIGNAWFSRVLHAEPRKLRRLLVVTSAFHMARCEAAFRWVYALRPQAVEFELSFEAVPDVGMREEALQARQKREAESLRALEPLARRYTDVEAFHRWLYSEHKAYAARSIVEPSPQLTGPVLETY
jgi:hypothetical protein